MSDPVLGTLERTDDVWSSRTTWVHSDAPFALSVYRSKVVPSPADAQVYEALRQSYKRLSPDIQLALLRLWNDYRAKDVFATKQEPEFVDPLALWHAVQLQGIGVYEDGHVELIYGFASQAHPEGAFMVGIRGQSVEALEYVE
ncbi:MAG: hypothetical protein AB7F38_00120 [Piscinibacter sp.]